MAKAALTKGSNYVGAASEYLQDARSSEGVSRSTSDDDSLDSARSRATRTPEPVDKLHLLPQWAVRKARRDKEGKIMTDENGKPRLVVFRLCTDALSRESAVRLGGPRFGTLRGGNECRECRADIEGGIEDHER